MIDFAEMFQNGYSGYERFQEILAIEPDIQDSQGSEELTDVKGTIVLKMCLFSMRKIQKRY